MRTADRFWMSGLGFAAFLIWVSDRSWLDAPGDALPLLAALPLFVGLAGPWRLTERVSPPDSALLAVAGATSVIASLTGSGLLHAVSWSAAAWSWLGQRLDREAAARVRRLLPLLVLAFPWLSLDFPSVGWWFRRSAAESTGHLFHLLGFAVHREGTQLLVAQMPFDLTPAGPGIKALQTMMVAGTALCHLLLGWSRWYWTGIVCLPCVAWLANTARVAAIVIASLSAGPEFASGWFHPVCGWLAVVGMFGFVWGGSEVLRRGIRRAEWA